MNDNKENVFEGLDHIEPMNPVFSEVNKEPVVPTMSFTEMKTEETGGVLGEVSYATPFTVEQPTPVVPLDVPIYEEPTSTVESPVYGGNVFGTGTPIFEMDDVVPVESTNVSVDETKTTVLDPENTVSYTEIPVAGVTEKAPDVVHEHPDARVTLHKEEDIPVVKENNEAIDKGTMWMLVWLFVGLLIVIIALPYLFKLF